MRLGIMQPYFLPYLGYFSLIQATDHFVVFDPVQYIRHGWINRNRILKPGLAEPQYIQLPLAKHSRQTLIRDIKLSQGQDWRSRIFAQIQHYKKKAPYFDQAKPILDTCLDLKTDSVVELNVHCLKTICNVLGMDFNYTMYNEIEPTIEPASHPGEWALHTCTALGASTYLNPIAGREIFLPKQFADRRIDLQFLTHPLAPYSQRNREFVPGLSILDVLMFNSLDETRRQINDYAISDP